MLLLLVVADHQHLSGKKNGAGMIPAPFSGLCPLRRPFAALSHDVRSPSMSQRFHTGGMLHLPLGLSAHSGRRRYPAVTSYKPFLPRRFGMVSHALQNRDNLPHPNKARHVECPNNEVQGNPSVLQPLRPTPHKKPADSHTAMVRPSAGCCNRLLRRSLCPFARARTGPRRCARSA